MASSDSLTITRCTFSSNVISSQRNYAGRTGIRGGSGLYIDQVRSFASTSSNFTSLDRSSTSPMICIQGTRARFVDCSMSSHGDMLYSSSAASSLKAVYCHPLAMHSTMLHLGDKGLVTIDNPTVSLIGCNFTGANTTIKVAREALLLEAEV